MYDIDGHKDLARDPRTNMIINVNDQEYQHYIASRDAKKAKNDDLDNMKEDLDSLKGEIGEIKSLLKELVNGN